MVRYHRLLRRKNGSAMEVNDLYYDLHDFIYGRVNVMTRRLSDRGPMIVIYDDHRWLLNVLFYLHKLGERYDLIYFDAHDDAASCGKKSALLEKIGVEDLNAATAKQFGAFVDYDQRIDDGGWLTTAMELNLIGDALNIGNRYSDNIAQMNGIYTSEDGVAHNLFELSKNLEYEFDCRGRLGDTCREDECRRLRDFFGIEHYLHSNDIPIVNNPYVLDFDLDFFTMSFDDEGTHGWTPKILNKYFPDNSRQDRFLRYLIRRAQVITICREPDYCGSLGDSNKILQMLDRYYFEGNIGTDTTL